MSDSPDPGMDGTHDDAAELRRLQQRAYGPSADIHDDPEALRRLDELQSAVASPADAGPSPSSESSGSLAAVALAPAREVELDPKILPAPEPDAWSDDELSTDASTLASSHRRARRMRLLWAGSILLTAVLAAGGSALWFSTRPTAPTAPPGAREADVLHETAGRVLPDLQSTGVLGEGSARSFEEFHGVSVMRVVHTGVGNVDEACLYVFRTSDFHQDTQSLEGQLYMGCSAGEFPATVQVRIDTSLPAAIWKRYPAGSALQFVLKRDGVHVYVDR